MSPNKIRTERSEQETDSVAFTKEKQGDHRISAVKADLHEFNIAPHGFPLPADGIQTNQKFYKNEPHPRT
ncbi:hypothetical protein F1728_21635 [Gimesia benthica]|uniref:Uncharacterized protein n=1 Tax=Gimesia benthica TaxID=2608982 RepID=A0A6I6AKP7_9PLAN|nr:hypothetical protein [Gimesia benthica]QGQ25129.1 hypothetical protein F1728_21635 [Gimesia benthica]